MVDPEVSEVSVDALLARAAEALENAWSPYSGLRVGAALLCDDGTVATGCNVENASYGLTICAERVAVAQAVASGRRAFRTIAIATEGERTVLPCGACRQVLAEFAPELSVVARSAGGALVEARLSELLPRAFGARDLGGAGKAGS